MILAVPWEKPKQSFWPLRQEKISLMVVRLPAKMGERGDGEGECESAPSPPPPSQLKLLMESSGFGSEIFPPLNSVESFVLEIWRLCFIPELLKVTVLFVFIYTNVATNWFDKMAYIYHLHVRVKNTHILCIICKNTIYHLLYTASMAVSRYIMLLRQQIDVSHAISVQCLLICNSSLLCKGFLL